MKKYQLPKEFATKWVEALRSGDYEQGRSYLHTKTVSGDFITDKYCCLGVACTINGIDCFGTDKEFISNDWDMPHQLKGNRINNNLIMKLTDMNDAILLNGYTHTNDFNQIADWIEQNVEFI